jgi:hypothetical protein
VPARRQVDDVDGDAAAAQRHRQGQAGDPAANDQDLPAAAHDGMLGHVPADLRQSLGVMPAHPISGLPEIGSLSAKVGYSRLSLGIQ